MRKAIRRLLGYFGYDFIKVKRTPFLKKEHSIHLGNYQLTMPAINPLIKVYTQNPQFASEIGRMTKAVHEKYPDLIFLDIGANTGDTIAIVKTAVDVPVIAVEGDEFSFSYLTRNAKQFTNVSIHNNFLGEKPAVVNVDLQKKGWNTTVIPAQTGQSTVEFKTLDTLLEEGAYPKSRIRILKIDCEGFDTLIIRGALNFIAASKPVIYFEYNRDNMTDIQEDGLPTLLGMADHGYHKVLFFDSEGRYFLHTDLSQTTLIRDMHEYADGRKGLLYYYNICLFHRNDTDIAERLIASEDALRSKG